MQLTASSAKRGREKRNSLCPPSLSGNPGMILHDVEQNMIHCRCTDASYHRNGCNILALSSFQPQRIYLDSINKHFEMGSFWHGRLSINLESKKLMSQSTHHHFSIINTLMLWLRSLWVYKLLQIPGIGGGGNSIIV